MISRMRRLTCKHVIALAVAAHRRRAGDGPRRLRADHFRGRGADRLDRVLVGLAVGVVPRSRAARAADRSPALALAGLAALMALSLAWASDDGDAYEDVVRALAYLGVFALVVLASRARRGRRLARRAGDRAGRDRRDRARGPLRAVARSATPTPSSPADLPAALGPAHLSGRLLERARRGDGGRDRPARLARRRARARAARARARRRRAAAGAAGAVDDRLARRPGRRRARLRRPARCCRRAPGARCSPTSASGRSPPRSLIAIAEAFGTISQRPAQPTAGGQGDRDARDHDRGRRPSTALGRLALDDAHQRPRASRAGPARDRVVAAAIAVIVALVAIDPVQQWDDFKAPPTGQRDRRAAASASCGAAAAAATSSGRRRWTRSRARPVGRRRRERLHALLARAPRRSRSRRTRAHSLLFETMAELGLVGLALLLGFFGAAVVAGVRRARAPDASPRRAPAAGAARRRLRRVGRRLDLGPARRLRRDGRRGGAADRAGDARRPRSRPPRAGARSARSRRRFAAGVGPAARRLGLDLRLRAAAALRPRAATRARTPPPAATSAARRAANDAIDRSRGRPTRAPSSRWSTSRRAISARREQRSPRRSSRSPRDYRLYLLAARMATRGRRQRRRPGGPARGAPAQPPRPRDPAEVRQRRR